MRRILFLFLYIFCGWRMAAQDLPMYIRQADSLSHQGLWEESLRLYERIRYFDETGQFHAELLKKTGLIRMAQKDYGRAAAAFESGYFSATDSAEKSGFLLLKSCALMHVGQFEDALMELHALKGKYIPDSAQFYMYLSTCLAMTNQTDSAVAIWKKCSQGDPVRLKTIDSIGTRLSGIQKISPKKAVLLSRIMPGLGQCYAHRYGPALNSFFLVGGLGVVFYLTAYNYTVLDAMIGVFPWFQRYYSGGAEKAGLMTLERKLNLQKTAVGQAIQLVF